MYMLIGGSGGPNYGDELMVKGWIDHLASSHNLRVEVNVKENAENFHSSKEVTFSDDLKKIAKAYTNLSFWEQVVRGFNFFLRGGEENYKNIDFSFLEDLEVVHLHGGGYLNKNAPANGFLLGFCGAVKERNKNVKVIATGIGIMPNDIPKGNKAKVANEVFGKFDGFEVRDHESFAFLRKATSFDNEAVLMGLDDSFLMKRCSVINQVETKKSPTLYLSFAKHNISSFSSEYWKELQEEASRFDDVAFWECYPWKDKEVFSYLKDKISSVRLASAKNIVYGGEGFSRHDFLITNRFHPHLVSSRIGMDGFYYVSNEYYDVKHNSVISSGSQFKRGAFSTCRIYTPSSNESKLLDRIDDLQRDKKVAIYEYMMER